MTRPPLLARVLLRLMLPSRIHEAIAGDLEEQWHTAGRSRVGYWTGVLRSIADVWRGGADRPGARPHGGVWRAIGADARFGARMMGRHRGFAAAAVLTLAIGIGASSAVFSAVWPILFDPLPYADSGRIVLVADRTNDGAALDVTYGTYRELLARSRAFESLAVVRSWQPVLTGPTEAERLEGGRVTAAYFDVLRTTLALGAGFDPADDRRGAPRAVILSDALWRRRFAADAAVLGTELTLGPNRYTVIGILPRTFEDMLLPGAEIWTLLQYDPALPLDGAEWGHHLRMVARLRDNVAIATARRELDEMARAPQPQFPRVPWASLANGFVVDALQEEITRGARPALLAFSAAVMLVLVIATANVANLLLARIVQRRREFAMRAALGASRGRLLGQLLVEGVMLALPAGAVGLLVARTAVNALVALGPVGLPRAHTVEIDGRVLAFSMALTFLVAIAVAFFPAVHASRGGLQSTLRDGGRTAPGGARAVRQGLVIAEVALALVLLISASLLFRSLNELVAISPGFDPSQVVAVQVQTSGVKFGEDDTVRQFFDTVVERISSVPGVTAVAAASQVPFGGGMADRYGITTERDYAGAGDTAEDGSAYRYAVTPEYFRVMAVSLRRGRLLEDADRRGAQPVVVISESLARRRFPGIDPIGHRLHVGPTDRPWFTVVGIVGDVIQESLETGEANAVYLTPGQWHFPDPTMWIVAKASAAHGLPAAIRGAVRSVDRDQPVVRVTTMDALLAGATADRRFALLVFGVFGAVALVLAVTGLYTTLARSVTERTREIGVRAALGASRAEILALILRQGLGLTAVGLVLGVAGALNATRLLETMLFGTSAVEPWTYAVVTALFLLVAAAACLVPAARAVAVDPAITLRAE